MSFLTKRSTKCLVGTQQRLLCILDGGMGEEIFRLGVPDDRKTWSAGSLIDSKYHPSVVQAHLNFIRAGCDIITTNNFAVIPTVFKPPSGNYNNNSNSVNYNVSDEIPKLTKLSFDLASQARASYSHINDKIFIAGSLPPLVESYRADTVLPRDQAIAIYEIIIKSLIGCDLFIAETMASVNEARYACEAVCNVRNNCINNKSYNSDYNCNRDYDYKSDCERERNVLISFSLNEKGLLRSNENINSAIEYFYSDYDKIENKWKDSVCGILFNCCSPESVDKAFGSLSDKSIDILEKEWNENGRVLGVYANALEMAQVKDDWEYGAEDPTPIRKDLTPNVYFDKYVTKWLLNQRYGKYIGVIGGCCGITPEHIEYMVDKLHAKFNTCGVRSKL